MLLILDVCGERLVVVTSRVGVEACEEAGPVEAFIRVRRWQRGSALVLPRCQLDDALRPEWGDPLTPFGSRRSRRTSPPIPPAGSSRLRPSRTRAGPKRQPRGEGRPTEKPCTPRPFPFDRGRRDSQPRQARRVGRAERPTRSIRRLTPHQRAARSPSTRSDQPATWAPTASRGRAHMTDHDRHRVDRRSTTHAPVNHRER